MLTDGLKTFINFSICNPHFSYYHRINYIKNGFYGQNSLNGIVVVFFFQSFLTVFLGEGGLTVCVCVVAVCSGQPCDQSYMVHPQRCTVAQKEIPHTAIIPLVYKPNNTQKLARFGPQSSTSRILPGCSVCSKQPQSSKILALVH